MNHRRRRRVGGSGRQVQRAVEAFQSGGIVVVRDEMHRENEGDFVLAAQHATPEAINFLLHAGRGLVCVALSGERCDELRLPLMVEDNTESMGSAFTVSVDARNGTTTGISAADRATTARLLADPTAGPEDFRRPGHVFPLRAADGGLRERRGHTEACLELTRRAGLRPAAVMCEILNEDGSMARHADLLALCDRYDLPLISVRDLLSEP